MLLGGAHQSRAQELKTTPEALVAPAPVRRAEQFEGPFQTVAQIRAAPLSAERLLTKGVAIYVARSGVFTVLAVQDATGTAYFYGPTKPPYQPLPAPGDRVEIAGEHRAPIQFYEAAWRVVGHERLPRAPSIAMAAAMNMAYDGKRARVRGRVVDYQTFVERDMNVSRIWVRDGDVVTYGNYIGPDFAPAPAKIGQLVELNGICNVGLVAPNVVRSYFVQLNRMSDARPLPEPWQNPAEHPIVNAIAAGLVGVSIWVMVLRHQVRTRTELLAESEAELRHALAREQELGKLKTAFISMVSHEFRTPLNIIVTSSDILSRYLDRLPAEEREEHLRSIRQSGKRMAGMMEDVLLLSRLESQRQKLNPQELHLAAWCRRFVEEMRSATGGRCPIMLQVGDFDPLVQADENILRHILGNLISNAVKYSSPGTEVLVSVDREEKLAVFHVEDHGIGIPSGDRLRLFEAFQRGSNVGQTNGTGLGLVVVKRGTELHGGRLEFTSEEGKGTVFTVRLPLFDPST